MRGGDARGGGDCGFFSPPVVALDNQEKGLLNLRAIPGSPEAVVGFSVEVEVGDIVLAGERDRVVEEGLGGCSVGGLSCIELCEFAIERADAFCDPEIVVNYSSPQLFHQS